MKFLLLNTEFYYDGVSGSSMGLSLVNIQSGMLEENFGYTRNIIEEKVPYAVKPYFFRFEKEPLTFTLTFAKINEKDLVWDFDYRKKVVNWLFQDDYKSLICMDNPEVIYYCTPINDVKRFDNGLLHGYITVTFRCNSPYAYTPAYIYTYNFVNSGGVDIIEIENLTNVEKYYYPEIEINMTNSTSVSIENLSDSGETFTFSNLTIGETIYVNNESEQIETSLGSNVYRLGDFNKNWLKLVQGVNRLRIIGEVNLNIKCIYPISN